MTPTGLTSVEAARRLREFGPNAVTDEPPPAWLVFLAKFWAPIPWLLEAAIALQIGLGEYIEAAVIGGLLVFNATLGFVQEGRAKAALDALKKRLAPIALVRRDGAWARLGAANLAPGDVIRLPLGALVPADATVVSGSISVDQSMLTGESAQTDVEIGSRVYAGAIVRRGEAVAEVTATGANTYFGRTVELVRLAHTESTEQKAILAATRNLAMVNGAVAAATVVAGYALALPVSELVRLGLTALLASIPIALPATFTLSAALGAQTLARRGVLLTRLSAAHEAAAIDILCADKTGTLTQNSLAVVEVVAMPGFGGDRLLALAAEASSEADQDPVDAAIRRAAAAASAKAGRKRPRFIPFDPATRMSEAVILEDNGAELRIAKGAFHAIAEIADVPSAARTAADELSTRGSRVIAVAAGAARQLKLVGLIALSDPPREDSAALIGSLSDMGVRTVMVTGDSPATATAIARMVGLNPSLCPIERLSEPTSIDAFSVFARVLPEQKYDLVKAFQTRGHVVGMCGDGVNDAPALRQAEIGVAVSSATDVAKAAAALVLTEPGLQGVVLAVREGRIAFQRLLTYTFNMLVKKLEIVLFLAIGLAVTGHAIITPALMVLLLVTNDFLSMSLTTDRASPATGPSVWRMSKITAAAVGLAGCKLGFSTAILMIGAFELRLPTAELQTLAFVTLVFGNQAVLYSLRERRRLWASRPGRWVLASSVIDVGIVTLLALSGELMSPLSPQSLVAVFAAAALFALALDQIKLPVMAAFEIE